MRILLSPSSAGIDVGSIVVLPELIGNDLDPGNYMREVRALAMELRAWVVGGAHFDTNGPHPLNCGVVVDPQGDIAEHDGVEAASDLNGNMLRALKHGDIDMALLENARTFDLLIPKIEELTWGDPITERLR